MAAAWDYLRSTLGDVDPKVAQRTADSVTEQLIHAADDARKENVE